MKIAKIAELEYAQLVTPGFAHRNAYVGEGMFVADGKTRLFLADVGGVPCVLIENKEYRVPGRIPLTNVSSFGLKDSKEKE